MKRTYRILVIISLIFMGISCEEDSADLSERELAIQDYIDNYLGSQILDTEWTGDIGTCDAGTVAEEVHVKVMQRINYFRRLVGLNDNTVFDASLHSRFQEAALMQSANTSSGLDHYPPESWDCYTEEGYNGSSSSNLSTGHSTNAITAFMVDQGSNNVNVGHRRWILHSQKTQFSYGTTNIRMSLGVFGGNGNTMELPPFIAYPPAGYIPYQLRWPRWSFGIPGATFSGATVSMTGPNGVITCNVISTQNGFGDNTIAWEPQNITFGAEEATYTVTVSDIESAEQISYTYEVYIIDDSL